MREILTQTVVAFVLISLTVELLGWAAQYWLGEAWWQRILPTHSDTIDSREPMRLQPALVELPGEEGKRS